LLSAEALGAAGPVQMLLEWSAGMARNSTALKVIAQAPVELIERSIYLARGRKVMFDRDLADIYNVETRALVQAVKRNAERFPEDFMFQLSHEEAAGMRSQTVIASRRNVRYRPYAFTEHGALMLASVLKSKRAVEMSIRVVRVFIQLREMLAQNKDLAVRIEKLEAGHRQHESALSAIVAEIRRLMKAPPVRTKKTRIGFVAQIR
jgi:hypothetical protein